MSEALSRLSSPYLTGGGGHNFEVSVQTAFAVLMLAGGYAPCLPQWPIYKIKLQGKYAGYQTDDFIAFARRPGDTREAKLLAQIKHSVSITEGDETFEAVIRSAWFDFNNQALFSPQIDAIALITGPLSSSDTENVRTILEWARTCASADEFIRKVGLARFSSDTKRAKLQAFRVHLSSAKGSTVTDNELWMFLRCFHLLGYDLDIKAGVTLSLLHSLIGQYSPDTVSGSWGQLVAEIQSANQNAGTLAVDQIPADIRNSFARHVSHSMPDGLANCQPPSGPLALKDSPYASDLVTALLLGNWDETLRGDQLAAESLAGTKYQQWINKMRDVLMQKQSPLKYGNGKWEVSDRLDLWVDLGPRLFDDHIERLRATSVSVLRERDPQFDLEPEKRMAASLYGKVLSHSSALRGGLAETLALLGSHPKALSSCSAGKAEETALLAVREILQGANWVRWASLNEVLPLLAEAAPRAFLCAVEHALSTDPCPFDGLYAQEGDGILGGNYMSGLLWALETLAWDAQFLIRVVMLLGGLVERDPGGIWSNRPANSLTMILLPWLPQTCAPIGKRKAAVVALLKELPEVAWRLLLTLLHKSTTTSFGSRKPTWREIIPSDWSKGVTHSEYLEQVSAYADLAIDAAQSNPKRLAELIEKIENLPPVARQQLLDHFQSESVMSMPEVDRLVVWTALMDQIAWHRKAPDAKWATSKAEVDKVADIAKALAPQAPAIRHRRLFGQHDFDLLEERGDYQSQLVELGKRREAAIREIASIGGVASVIAFAKSVQSSWHVGIAYGGVAENDADPAVLPNLLGSEQTALTQFTGGYVRGRHCSRGWQWVDEIDICQWEATQVGQLLAYLPFTADTWARSARLLGNDESAYWTTTSANPYGAVTASDLEVAADQLLRYGRPVAAIRCLHRVLTDKQCLDCPRVVRALLATLEAPKEVHQRERHQIVDMIIALQSDPRADLSDLARIEWSYLPLLDRQQEEAYPKLLEHRLASDPEFFCELIRLVFRSRKEERKTTEPTDQQRSVASNAYRLLSEWKTPPGYQEDGTFNGDALDAWLDAVKEGCAKTGHLETGLTIAGQVLIHAPVDPDGLWIHRSAAAALNSKDASHMREGFIIALQNSRGIHWVDPEAREEQALAQKYREQADSAEMSGYHRLATALRELSASYDREVEGRASGYDY